MYCFLHSGVMWAVKCSANFMLFKYENIICQCTEYVFMYHILFAQLTAWRLKSTPCFPNAVVTSRYQYLNRCLVTGKFGVCAVRAYNMCLRINGERSCQNLKTFSYVAKILSCACIKIHTKSMKFPPFILWLTYFKTMFGSSIQPKSNQKLRLMRKL